MDIQIRKAKKEDIPIIIELTRSMWLKHAEENPDILDIEYLMNYDAKGYFEKYIENKTSEVFLAETDGEVIGVIRAEIVELEGMYKEDWAMYSDDMVVREDFRGKGVGTILKERVLQYAEEHDIKLLKTRLYSFNDIPQKMNTKMGYKNVYSEWYKVVN